MSNVFDGVLIKSRRCVRKVLRNWGAPFSDADLEDLAAAVTLKTIERFDEERSASPDALIRLCALEICKKHVARGTMEVITDDFSQFPGAIHE